MSVARPVHDGVSKRQVKVGLLFATALDGEAIRAAMPLFEGMRDRYARRQEHQTVALGMGSGVAPPGSQLVGFSFDRLRPDGEVEQALAGVNNSLQMSRTACSDLAQVQREAYEEFATLLPMLGGQVTNVIVERLDRFVWDGAYGDFHAERIFRVNSPWLVPNVFSARDLWHSNHGYFEYRSAPRDHRLLHTVEVHVVPAAEATPRDSDADATVVADVKQTVNALNGMREPGGSEERLDSAAAISAEGGAVREYLPFMFSATDSVLHDIVNEEMLSRLERKG